MTPSNGPPPTPADSHPPMGLILQDLEPIVTGALHRFRALLPADVKLAVEFFCENPRVRADAEQLGHAFLSAFIIAWQSIDGGAKQVVVSFREVLLDDSGRRATGAKHQGGLPPKRFGWLSVSNDLWEAPGPFHEHIPVTTAIDDRPASARRLPLADIKAIIATHQGMISALATPGKGTTFEIHLPTVLSLDDPETSAAGTERMRVVYVDDYEAMRDLINETLQDAGFSVTSHEGSKSALAAIEADPASFDAVVTDYRLHGSSGIDLLTQIKRIRVDLPVIIISGFVDEALKTKARENGALLVISKSRDLSELCVALRQLFARQARQRAWRLPGQ